MQALRKLCQSDESGTLHLEVAGLPSRRVLEVLIVWAETPPAPLNTQERSIKEAEMYELAGALADDRIERAVQGTFEVREPIE